LEGKLATYEKDFQKAEAFMDQTSKLAEEQKKFSNLNKNFEDLKKDNDAKKREAEDLKSNLKEERKVLAMIRSKSSM
jgi:uncharacterized protein HemY